MQREARALRHGPHYSAHSGPHPHPHLHRHRCPPATKIVSQNAICGEPRYGRHGRCTGVFELLLGQGFLPSAGGCTAPARNAGAIA